MDMKRLRLIAGYSTLLTALSGLAGATEYDVLQPLRVEGTYAVFQGTAEVQGSAFSVGGTTMAVKAGLVGIGTNAPAYLLQVSTAAGAAGNMVVISTGASNVVRMTGAGEIYANKYYGDGSALTGVPGNDNLGNHTATTTLNMAGFNVVNVSSVNYLSNVYIASASAAQYGGLYVSTHVYFSAGADLNNLDAVNASGAVTASSVTASGIGLLGAQLRFNQAAGNIVISSEASQALGGGVRVSTNMYIVGYASATKFYGDGSSLTGLTGLADNLGNHTATQNLNLNGWNIVNISTLNAYSNGVYVATNAFVMGNFGVGTSSPTYKMYLAGGDFRNENDMRTGNISDPGRWRFYDISGYLMSRWVPGTDYDTWGLYWDQTNHKMIWRGNGTDESSIDLDDGSGYNAGNLGVGGQPGPASRLEVVGGSVTIQGLSTQTNVLQAGLNGIVISTGGAITTAGVGNGTVAGNARGNGAVDLQTSRGAAAQAATGAYSVLAGGSGNTAAGLYVTVAGGYNNSANNQSTTISGGESNTVNNTYATVAGGISNTGSGYASVVSGGYGNTASNLYSAVHGGQRNTAGGSYSAVPGGYGNLAQGNYSFAAGFASTATAAGAFTWADSQGTGVNNTVTDRVLFKDQGGFMVTGSTNTVLGAGTDRGVLITGNGLVGISTGVPYAPLDVVSTATANTVYAQIWRNSSGVAVASVTSTGYISAVKFYGDGSGLTGVGGNDNLGNHIATQDLKMSSFGIVNVSTVSGTGIYISSYGVIQTAGPGLNNVTGNVRGIGAVDLQPFRGSAGDVASGNYSVVGGGQYNSASGVSATVPGGWTNAASGANSTVSGGSMNTASGSAAAVPGGYNNTALGQYSLAAGYYSSSTANGAFTWSDSQGTLNQNSVADRTVFKNRGGFLITGSTNTVLGASADRGVFITGSGLVGISTGVPQAPLDIVSTATADTVYANIWRNSSGIIVASMTSTGKLFANIAGSIGGGDNLGNHTATQALNLNNNQIMNVSSLTVLAPSANPAALWISSVGAAVPALYVSTGGRVGIGTANPDSQLTIYTNPASPRDGVAIYAPTAGAGDFAAYALHNDETTGYLWVGSSNFPDAGRSQLTLESYFKNGIGLAAYNGGGIKFYTAYAALPKMTLDASGTVGIGTGTPQAVLDIVSTGTAANIYAQIWRNGSGVIVGSMSSTGYLTAVKFVGDGSGLTGIGGNDNLGNHTATQDLKMQGFSIVNAASGTFNQALTTYSSMTVAGAAGIGAPKHYFSSNVEISSYTSAYGAGIYVSTLTYTPGMVLTGFGELQTTGVGRGTFTGNARGAGAVDLQVNRGAVTQVASGGYSVVGGGQSNTAAGQNATVPGGSQNTAGNQYSTVGGGLGNNASGDSSVIPGGRSNSASGTYALAAGYNANSTGNGGFTWADSAGVQVTNAVADRTVFKDVGGFVITGSTNTVMTGALDRGVFISGTGLVGVSTGTPQAAMDVVSSATASNVQAQLWRNSSGAIVGSMSSTGYMTAVKFVGDGSGLTGAGDNLGNHTAIQDLKMAGFNILNTSSITANGGITTYATMTVAGNAFSVGGTALVASNGSLGLGTATPGASLDIVSTGTAGNIYSQIWRNGSGVAVASMTSMGTLSVSSFVVAAGYNPVAPVARFQSDGITAGATNDVAGAFYGTVNSGVTALPGGLSRQRATVVIGSYWEGPGNNLLNIYNNTYDAMLLVRGDGGVGIGRTSPEARLDVVSTGTAANVYAQIWRNGSGVIVGSMSSTGYLTAVKFVGDGSGLSGTADDLGNHTATQNLNMSGYSILNATSVYVNAGTLGTVSGSSQTLASLQFSDTNGDKLMAISTRTADGSDWTTAGVMLKRRVDLTDMGYIKFGSQSSDLLTFGRNQSEYVRIDSAGNVGIGNNNPTTKLSVGGTTQVDFDTSNSGKVVIKVGGVAVAEMLPN
jgi:hypothetical protein